MKKESEDFSYEKKVKDSTDILSARDKIQEYAGILGFKKTQLTILATAASETYRLFIKGFDNVNTKIRIKDSDPTRLTIHISGILRDNQKEKKPEVVNDLNQKLEKVITIFSDFEFSVRTETIVLILVKYLPGDKITKKKV